MKALLFYMKDRWLWLLGVFLFTLFGVFVFWLYQLNFEALLYWLLLSSAAFFLLLSLDYFQYAKLLREADKAIEDELYNFSPFQGYLAEQMQKLQEGRRQQVIELTSRMEEERKEQSDYYTLWSHQAKLPAAALHLILDTRPLHLEDAKSQLRRLDQYLDLVMAYQRLNSISSDYHFEVWNLDDSLRKIIRSFFPEFHARKIHLFYEETKFQVLSDRKWLEFVLEQIFSNALKYTKSSITVTVRKETICIEDDGPGIEEADLQRIFQKGYTGGTQRLNHSASGLGLYLCREVLQKLHHPFRMENILPSGTRVCIDVLPESSRLKD